MTVSKIAVAYQRKFNLGDYNSLSLECTAWADLEPGEDHIAQIAVLQEQVREAVRQEFSRIPARNGAQSGNPKPHSAR